MRAASHLPGRGPLLWIWPLYLHVNQKSNDDDHDEKGSNLLKLEVGYGSFFPIKKM